MNKGNSDLKSRMPVAAGRFYPDNKELLLREITGLFDSSPVNCPLEGVRALISPHAGYSFSGKVAASAFSALRRDTEFQNIFLIGSSHRTSFPGASVYYKGDYLTPLGLLKINHEIEAGLIAQSGVFTAEPDAHNNEHSIEVQLPFLQFWLRKLPPIVPIVIGTNNLRIIMNIAEVLKPWFTQENLFVISTDFSHYPDYSDAVSVDSDTADALISGSAEILLSQLSANDSAGIEGLSTSMCGWSSVLTLLHLTEASGGMEYIHLQYMNSGDSIYGDKNGVVGYHAIAVVEKQQ